MIFLKTLFNTLNINIYQLWLVNVNNYFKKLIISLHNLQVRIKNYSQK